MHKESARAKGLAAEKFLCHAVFSSNGTNDDDNIHDQLHTVQPCDWDEKLVSELVISLVSCLYEFIVSEMFFLCHLIEIHQSAFPIE